MLSSCSHSQSGNQNNSGPFPGTTKHLHQWWVPLLITVTLHIPICGMHGLLCVHNTIFCLWIFFSSVMFVCRKDICTWWWALSCHHYLYLFYIPMFWFFDYFLFLALSLLLILCYGIWNLWYCHIKLLCFHLSFLGVLAHTMSCPFYLVAICWHLSALVSAHLLEVINLSHLAQLLHRRDICRACMCWSQYLQLLFCHFSAFLCVLSAILLLFMLFIMASNTMLSPVASGMSFWALCASTFLDQHNTCSLVISFCLFDCGWLPCYLNHHVIIIYAI